MIKAYFDQHLECTVLKRLSKYTTLHSQLRFGRNINFAAKNFVNFFSYIKFWIKTQNSLEWKEALKFLD